jgi:hypothetical protein
MNLTENSVKKHLTFHSICISNGGLLLKKHLMQQLKNLKFISNTVIKLNNYTYFKANVQSVNNEKDAFLRVKLTTGSSGYFQKSNTGTKKLQSSLMDTRSVYPAWFFS